MLALTALGLAWSSASCASSTWPMASSSCSAPCSPGVSPICCPRARAGFVAALIVSPLVGARRRCGRPAAAAADRLRSRADIVATIGLRYLHAAGRAEALRPRARPVAAPFDWRIQFPWFGYSGYKLVVVALAALVLAAVWLL